MSETKERRICGAKKKDGSPCRAQPMANGRCRLHGGLSLTGLASPTFKHGRYSKYLPARLADRYHESQSDPELLVLRHEISVIDARLGDLLGRVDTGEAGTHWRAAQAGFSQLKTALGTSDPQLLQQALDELQKHLRAGLADHYAWEEVYSALEQRRRLVDSERKWMIQAQQVITADRAMVLIASLIGVVKEHVRDPITLSAISTDVGKLLTGDVR